MVIAVETRIHRRLTHARLFVDEREIIVFQREGIIVIIVVIIIVIIIILKVFSLQCKGRKRSQEKSGSLLWGSSWPSADISKHMYIVLYHILYDIYVYNVYCIV